MNKLGGIDLGNLGAMFARKTEAAPAAVPASTDKEITSEIVGVVIMKGEGFDSMVKQIADAGFDIATSVESDDGSVIFKQGDLDGEGIVVRLSEHVALVTKGFTPYGMTGLEVPAEKSDEDMSFAEMCVSRGFYPGVSTIMEVLTEQVRKSMYSSETAEAAQEAVTKAFKDATAYTSDYLAKMPLKAFKLEVAEPDTPEAPAAVVADPAPTDVAPIVEPAPVVEAVVAKADEVVEAVVKSSCDDMAKEGKSHEEMVAAGHSEEEIEEAKRKYPAKKEDQAPAPEITQEVVAKPLTAEEVSGIVTSHVTKSLEGVAGTLSDVSATLIAIQKSLETETAARQALETRMGEAELVAKSAQEAVSGAVVTGSETGDHAPVVVKSESRGFGREIDTAFMPRARARSARN